MNFQWLTYTGVKSQHAFLSDETDFSSFSICGRGGELEKNKDPSKPRCKTCIRLLEQFSLKTLKKRRYSRNSG